jgi:nucleotide-binding universal stress UspA family protein
MLDKALADTDPQTTDVVVMTAKVEPQGADMSDGQSLDLYDQQLLTAVVNHAEKLGKSVTPLLVPTNNSLHAVLNTAKSLPCQEILLGASNKYTAEEQLDQIAFYWIHLHGGAPQGLTVHIVSHDRDITLDLDGGNRIPKAIERHARSITELRKSGHGVERVLQVHDGAQPSSDVFEWLLTMLASSVQHDVVRVASEGPTPTNGHNTLSRDRQWAQQLGRPVNLLSEETKTGPEIVSLSRAGDYDAIVLPAASAWPPSEITHDEWMRYIIRHASCSVFIAIHPAIPREVVG